MLIGTVAAVVFYLSPCRFVVFGAIVLRPLLDLVGVWCWTLETLRWSFCFLVRVGHWQSQLVFHGFTGPWV